MTSSELVSSKAKAGTGGEEMAAWEPANTCYVRPSIVILCGPVPGDDAQAIRNNVCNRLGLHVPISVVRWTQIPSADDIVEDRLDQVIAPLLELETWQQLASAGYVRDLPGDKRLSLQVIVVYYLRDGHEKADAPHLLSRLATAVKNVLSGKAEFSLSLILLGDGALDLDEETQFQYWPRIRLQTAAVGGARVDHDRVVEACQSIIVALLTSELARAIDHAVGPDRQLVGWIWMGAAALIADLARMREFLRLLVLRDLIHPIIGTPLAPAECRLLTKATQDKVESLQAATLMQALAIASHYSWTGEATGQRVQRFGLSPDAELRAQLHTPGSDISKPLTAHYTTLRDALIEHLAPTASEQYGRLIDVFSFLLDRSVTGGGSGGSPLSLQETWPSGLSATLYAVESATIALKDSLDVYSGEKDVPAHAIGSDYFLTAVAESDTGMRDAGFRRLRRFRRTISSPQGLLFKLIPAWPLLTGMLLTVSQWTEARSALIAAIALVVTGVLEWVLWWLLAKRRLNALHRQVEEKIANSVLGLIAKSLGDYRLRTVGQLRNCASTLKRLLSLLQQTDTDIQKRLGALNTWYETLRRETASVYRLVDFERCQEWAESALRQANEAQIGFSSVTAALIAQHVFPLLHQTGSYRHIVREIEATAENLVGDSFRSDVLEAYALTEYEDVLKDGRRWQWLYQRAHPLGGSDSTTSSFTIVTLANDAALMGASGQSSEYWQDDWLVARSRQPHEIICLRGLVERST